MNCVADGDVVSSAPARLTVLDGLRGCAVLMVMGFHYPWPQLPPLMEQVRHVGQLGVDLFFVLSGFLITGILIDVRDKSGPVLRNFYIRRSLRIFPLYYGVLAVLYVAGPALGLLAPAPLREQWWFWLYMQNVGFTFTTLAGPNHFWSLAVEEHFYLVWPAIVRYATPQHLRRWLVGAIALTLVSRAVLLSIGAGTFYFTLCRLDGLALGGLVAIAAREQGGLQRLVRPALWTMAGLSPVIATLMMLFSGEGTPLVQVVKSTLLGAWFALFLVVLVQAPVASLLHRVFSIRALRSVGTYSYAMYVFHPFVFGMLAAHLRRYPLAIQGIGACVAVYFAAYASWLVWERHFLALKDRFDYVRPAA